MLWPLNRLSKLTIFSKVGALRNCRFFLRGTYCKITLSNLVEVWGGGGGGAAGACDS